LKYNYSQMLPIERRHETEILAKPFLLTEMVFRTIETPPNVKNISAFWQMENISEANAIAIFNQSTFTDDIVMDSFKSQSWGTTIYEFQPFAENAGTLNFSINMDGAKSVWAISMTSESGNKVQNYSPTFTPARIKMAQQMTPHRRFKAPKVVENNQVKKK
jgi:hypothetical protein